MLARMTARQFLEWRIFADLEPFDEERMDQRFASLEALFVNLHRAKGVKPVTLQDRRLWFGDAAPPAPPPKSWQDLKAIAVQHVAASKPKSRPGKGTRGH